jgi:hypothetical protein
VNDIDAPADGSRASLLRLTLARACAWALLVAGWIGLGTFALRSATSVTWAFGVVALWLLALGAAATAAGRLAWLRSPRRGARSLALAAAALVTCAALPLVMRGGGVPALVAAVAGWAALTALASGVVRSVRLVQHTPPGPPIAAATLGALAAGIVLGDLGDLAPLALRLALFVGAVTLALVLLQRRTDAAPRTGCRAGLFDCSLPAWPAGAWRDPVSWPTLLAGLAMLPMMASLPLMADWCRAESFAPEAAVLLHLAAMFVPALLLRHALARWSLRALATVCVALLAAGAAAALWAHAPYDLLGLAAAHGAAWGLAWGGQLWAPERRGQQGASPLRAAAGYAALTLAFGAIVEWVGMRGVVDVHAALALAALGAWTVALVRARQAHVAGGDSAAADPR